MTSVACAFGPSVNILRQLIFPSKPNFCNLFEFPATKKSTQKSIIWVNFTLLPSIKMRYLGNPLKNLENMFWSPSIHS
jgi:hypothetical protein